MAKDIDFKSLAERLQLAYNRKLTWTQQYENVYRYVAPHLDALDVFFGDIDPRMARSLRNQRIYDPTAQTAATKHREDIMSFLMPHDRKWGQFKIHEARQQEGESEYPPPVLAAINDSIQTHLQASNLTKEANRSLEDLAIGTAALLMEPGGDEEPLKFTAIPGLLVLAEENQNDLIDNVWVKNTLPARSILEKFPDYDGKLKDQLKANPNAQEAFFHGQIWDNEDERYIFYAVLDRDRETPLFEPERKRYKNIMVFRKNPRPGETEGYGVALKYLPSIITLNKIREAEAKGIPMRALPPLFNYTDATHDNLNARIFASLEGTVIQAVNDREPLKSMQFGSQPEVGQVIERLTNELLEGFKVDPLGTLEQPVRSATEINIRENRAMRHISTAMASDIYEIPRQVFFNAAAMLNDNDHLPLGGFKHNDPRLAFDFDSEIFEGQKEQKFKQFQQYAQTIQQYFGEQAFMGAVNVPEAVHYLADITDMPENIRIDKSNMNDMMQKLKEMMQQQLQKNMQAQPSTEAAKPPTPEATGPTI